MDFVTISVLHEFRLHFECNDDRLNLCWQRLFAGWQTPSKKRESKNLYRLKIKLRLEDVTPASDAEALIFQERERPENLLGWLSVYKQSDDRLRLYFEGAASIAVSLHANHDDSVAVIDGVVSPEALVHGLFEDIIMTSLAPFLRRRGYYLLHAFAAGKDGGAVILAGPTGNGKTTSGLSLLLQGWQLLSNDSLLLHAADDAVLALPTPGSVNIRQGAVQLLPRLRPLLKDLPVKQGKYIPPTPLFAGGSWSKPARVDRIFFPEIDGRPHTSIRPMDRALCLAKLMAESIDRWDEAMLTEHVKLLERLSMQAVPYTLQLGADVVTLPDLLERSSSVSSNRNPI